MNTDFLLHRETLHVRGYDVTKSLETSVPAIIQMMHEAAMQHVLRLEVSANQLAPHDLGWALHQQSLEVYRLPVLGEQIKILTHPSGIEKLLTYRDFHLFDDKDQLLARASSSWFLMNLRRRRVARYPDFISTLIEPSNELAHLPRPAAPDTSLDEPTRSTKFQVHYHDLDFNGHLSNYHYAKWMLDTVPADRWETAQLRSFDIRFLAECLLDDEVTVALGQKDDNTFLHQITKGGEAIAYGASTWKKRT